MSMSMSIKYQHNIRTNYILTSGIRLKNCFLELTYMLIPHSTSATLICCYYYGTDMRALH